MASAQEVGKLIVRLMGDSTHYQKMLDNAAARARRFGTVMSAAVTAPILGLGASAARAMSTFDHAMTEATSIMDVPEEQLKRMRQAALDLASGGAIQAPAELARSYYFLASAGMSAEQAIAALPAVADFATAGAFDLELATSLLSDAQSSLGLRATEAAENLKNLTRVSDVMVKAGILSNASTEQFAKAITSGAGPALKMFNKDIEEGAAVLGALADQGIKAEVAGTSLTRLLTLLSQASQTNQAAFKKHNFTVFDASGKMRNMADIIANLETSMAGMSDEQKSATLTELGFAAEAQKAIVPLLGLSGTIRRYQAELYNAGGTTESVAQKQLKSFTNQLKLLWNQFTVILIQIGSALQPALESLVGTVSNVAKFMGSLSNQAILVIAGVLAMAAAIGPLLIGFSMIASGISAMLAVIGAILSPIGLLIGAIIGIAAAVIQMTIGWGGAIEALKAFFGAALGFISNFTENMGILFTWIRENWWKVLTEVGRLLWETLKALPNWTLVALRTVVRLWVAWQGWLLGMFERIFSMEMVRWVWDGLKKAAKAFGEFALWAWEKLKSIFSGKQVSMNDFASQLATDFEKGVTEVNFFKTAGQIIADEAANLKNPLEGAFEDISLPKFNTSMGTIVDDAKKVVDATAQVANTGAGKVEAATDRIRRAFYGNNQAVMAGTDEFYNMLQKVQSPTPTAGVLPTPRANPIPGEQPVDLTKQISENIKKLVEVTIQNGKKPTFNVVTGELG